LRSAQPLSASSRLRSTAVVKSFLPPSSLPSPSSVPRRSRRRGTGRALLLSGFARLIASKLRTSDVLLGCNDIHFGFLLGIKQFAFSCASPIDQFSAFNFVCVGRLAMFS
jgi:hypothetical protein